MALYKVYWCSNFAHVPAPAGQEAVMECAHRIVDRLIGFIAYPHSMVANIVNFFCDLI